jgi:dCMP deaminase
VRPSKIKQKMSSAESRLYSIYKSTAKKRKLTFNINLTLFSQLIKQQCTYCTKRDSSYLTTRDGIFTYNGLDRWHNTIGYEPNNVVTCCQQCNFLKNSMDGNEFIEWLSNILKNTNRPQNIKPNKLFYYHSRAIAASENSHDKETKVGAVLIDPRTGAVIAEGYNGFVRKAKDDLLPTTRPEKYDYMIHAETNLLCNAVRSGAKTDDCVLYCTLSPCTKCMRMLWQAGISSVYFKKKYRDFKQSMAMLDLEPELEQVGSFYKIKIKPRS